MKETEEEHIKTSRLIQECTREIDRWDDVLSLMRIGVSSRPIAGIVLFPTLFPIWLVAVFFKGLLLGSRWRLSCVLKHERAAFVRMTESQERARQAWAKCQDVADSTGLRFYVPLNGRVGYLKPDEVLPDGAKVFTPRHQP